MAVNVVLKLTLFTNNNNNNSNNNIVIVTDISIYVAIRLPQSVS